MLILFNMENPQHLEAAGFQQQKFWVSRALFEVLKHGDDKNQDAATQYFLEVFVGHELEGLGFWTSAPSPVFMCCEISHKFCECVHATWNYIDGLTVLCAAALVLPSQIQAQTPAQ